MFFIGLQLQIRHIRNISVFRRCAASECYKYAVSTTGFIVDYVGTSSAGFIKNIVVSPESWIIDNLWGDNDFAQSIEKFRSQHEKLGMPRFLSFSQGDNYFIVDEKSDVSVREFFNLTKKMKTVTLSEFLPLSEDMDHYVAVMEIVQPFIPAEK